MNQLKLMILRSKILLLFILVNASCQENVKETYYVDGQIRTSTHFKNGMKNGESIKYYKGGKIKQIDNYKDSFKFGLSKYYSESGRLSATEEYRDGKSNGLFISYHSNGTIYLKAKIVNDSTLGYLEYDSLGNLIDEYYKVKLKSFSDTIRAGESFRTTISIRGLFTKKNISIFPVFSDVDTSLKVVYNKTKYSYISPSIIDTGNYLFQVYVYIDSSLYYLYEPVFVIPN